MCRLLTITGLFCRRASLLYVSFAKETYYHRYIIDTDICLLTLSCSSISHYGMATISRLVQRIGLFCTRAL